VDYSSNQNTRGADATSPSKGKEKMTTYFHATLKHLEIGDKILPASVTKVRPRWNETNPTFAYAMRNLEDGLQWASKDLHHHIFHDHGGEWLAWNPEGCCKQFVYECEPTEHIEDEPDMPWNGVQSRTGFTIVKIHEVKDIED
tara:strand:- start:152 stop:580 length:429 start_codon:yes stop_codon:yes gene_type:complete